jgi:hypothetical protein
MPSSSSASKNPDEKKSALDAKNRIAIRSEDELKANAVTILRRVHADERGGLLFLINPVFALEEAGFDLSPAMRTHIRRGLRYGTKTKTRMRELEVEVTKLAGHEVNVASDSQVTRLLFDELKLQAPAAKTSTRPVQLSAREQIYELGGEPEPEAGEAKKVDYTTGTVAELRTALQQRGLPASGTKTEMVTRLQKADTGPAKAALSAETLQSLQNKHPIVPKIIELRQLQQTGWRFVNRETYDKVKSGASVTLLRKVRFNKSKFGKAGSEGGKVCR